MNQEQLIAMAARRATLLWKTSEQLRKAAGKPTGDPRLMADMGKHLDELAVILKANKLEEWEQDIADTPMGETP